MENEMLDDLTAEMKDLMKIYDEVFDGQDVKDYTKEQLLTFIDDTLILSDRIIAVIRTNAHRLDVIERLMQVFDPDYIKEITGEIGEKTTQECANDSHMII